MEFEEAKREYLEGRTFQYRTEKTTGFATLDDLMMKMYLDNVPSINSRFQFSIATNMMTRQMAHISMLMDEDHGDAQEANQVWLASTVGDWMLKAFRRDDDFIEKAVQLILDGEAGRYFE